MTGAVGPSVSWYLTRSSGAVALLLLTGSVVLGVLEVRRLRTPKWPRFVVDSLHRNVSLLVLVFLVLHIVTSAVDSFAPIPLIDSVLPFVGGYRPLWLGLGALSFDLFLAVAITSVVRQRLGYRAWRATHWLAYASWPVALLHGLGTGSDIKSTWMLGLTALCVAAGVGAITLRAVPGWPDRAPVRAAALAATAALIGGLLLWLPGGPLGRGWARRSGTPAAILASTASAPTGAGRAARPDGASAVGGMPAGPFRASLAGTLTQAPGPASDLVAVHLATRLSGGASGRLNIEIDGSPTAGGGVVMSASRVTLGPTGDPALYRGRVTSLSGRRLAAHVAAADGRGLALDVVIASSADSQTVSGALSAAPTLGGVSR